MPSNQKQQAIQDIFESPRGPRRMITDRAWVKATGHGASLMLATAGVFVVVASVFTPTLGSTRSAKLAWEKSARQAAQAVDACGHDSSMPPHPELHEQGIE
jgi:hypothetical protein